MERKSCKIWVRFFTLLCLLSLSVSCSSSEDGEESTDNDGANTFAPTVAAAVSYTHLTLPTICSV